MNKIGIFFGSDTGNTENVAQIIHKKIGVAITEIYDIAKSTKEDVEAFNILLFGIPTWYYGEIQCDWDDFLPTLKEMNFEKKIVGFFGCGDQEDYSEYFCDAISIVYNIVKSRGAIIIGYWPVDGYHFECSKSLVDKNHFMGLPIDEDRQPNLTNDRITMWVKKILEEIQYINKLI